MNFKFKIKFAAALVALAILRLALPVSAQVTPFSYGVIYPLTNATTFTLALGSTNLATAALTLINSPPFPVIAGRGFSVTISAVGTNAATSAVTPYFQFCTPN